VFDGGNFLLVTDGFNDVRAKLMPSCKTLLKEKYPSFCQLNTQQLTHFLIAIKEYQFVVTQKASRKLTMSRASLNLQLEIKNLSIVMAERVPFVDL